MKDPHSEFFIDEASMQGKAKNAMQRSKGARIFREDRKANAFCFKKDRDERYLVKRRANIRQYIQRLQGRECCIESILLLT